MRFSFYYSHLPNFMVKYKPQKASANHLYYFSSIKNDYTSFFYLVIFLSFHAVVGGHATGINSKSIFFLHAFWCFYLLAPSYMSNIVNSLRITIVTIFIIKNSVIKGILLRTISLLKNIRVYITKDYIIIRKYRMIKFFDYLICNKPIRNKF